MKKNTKYITKVGILTAVSIAIMFLFEFPILPNYPMLKMDFSEVPVLLAGFSLGPAAAIIIEFLKNLIHAFIKGDGTGGVGNLANFLVGIALCVPAAWYYLKHKTLKGAIIGLVIGVVCMVVTGALVNYFIILPLYGMNEHSVKMAFILGGATPFNAIKSVILSVVTLLLYKPLSSVLHS